MYDNEKPYDCEFICKLRDEDTDRRYQEELEFYENETKRIKEILDAEEEKEKKQILKRLKKGKITREEYNTWAGEGLDE